MIAIFSALDLVDRAVSQDLGTVVLLVLFIVGLPGAWPKLGAALHANVVAGGLMIIQIPRGAKAIALTNH